jgi:hypothetical protein
MASALLLNPVLHHLPWLEGDGASHGHHDLLAGTGITSRARFPPSDLKNAEVAKLDPTVLHEYVYDGVERLLDNLLGLALCQAKFLGNRQNALSLAHESILPP